MKNTKHAKLFLQSIRWSKYAQLRVEHSVYYVYLINKNHPVSIRNYCICHQDYTTYVLTNKIRSSSVISRVLKTNSSSLSQKETVELLIWCTHGTRNPAEDQQQVIFYRRRCTKCVFGYCRTFLNKTVVSVSLRDRFFHALDARKTVVIKQFSDKRQFTCAPINLVPHYKSI